MTDEDKCPNDNKLCQAEEFQCEKDKRCLPNSWRCDEIFDCDDDSDETGCEGDEVVPSPSTTNTTLVSSCGPSSSGNEIP